MKLYTVIIETADENFEVEIPATNDAEAMESAAIYANYEMDIEFDDIQDTRVVYAEEVEA